MKFSNLQLANISLAGSPLSYEMGMRLGGALLCARDWPTATIRFARDVRIGDPMT